MLTCIIVLMAIIYTMASLDEITPGTKQTRENIKEDSVESINNHMDASTTATLKPKGPK